ncbi:unnamed protein product [Linum trigynum]|uniref:Uncharacterized protein n=1 Tax=Linum trigynum TaxID=586398 RepID=A0AAV2E093_9ROSI
MRKSRADFAVMIHESWQRSSSRSKNVVFVIQLGKISISPWLLPREVRALSPPIHDCDLGLPGRDLQLEFAFFVPSCDLQLPGHDLQLPSPLLHL